MNRFKAIGSGFIGFGGIIASFSYFVIFSIPLTALGLAFAILGCVILIFPEYLVPHQVVKGMISGSITNIEAMLEEFSVNQRAIYLPSKDGKIYAFVPLLGNPSYPEIREIVYAPKRVISNVDGHAGLFIYPPGSDVVVLSGAVAGQEDKTEQIREGKVSLEDFLPQLENTISYCLVDFSEFASKIRVNFDKNKIFLGIKNVKIDVEAPRFTRVLGSPPASLAACCIAQVTRMPVRIIEEKKEGKWVRVVLDVGE
ncbi:MAG TPA: hypothetical protein ENG47_03420 [Candidatus Aerophobetes bacterium]|uniref:DUF7982 domain-containing protein n=1 Tax=Aerophobetes bacterium TaxID=2030807 RepID=A0A7V0MZ98_UNCAE|nr:hypothetical protein [Candidatus Aerophobetes bacterium]